MISLAEREQGADLSGAEADGNLGPPLSSFDYLERLNDQQVGHMARVNIHTDVPMPFTVHLRSGSAAASSVSGPACTHRSWFPAAVGFHRSRAGR